MIKEEIREIPLRTRSPVPIENSRETFSSRLGFTIACIGSAVGMGNIWMFPYRVGQYGGFAFLIPYIIFVMVLGFSGVVGEMAFGRAMNSGPIDAFKKAVFIRTGKNWGSVLGVIPVIGSFLAAIGYSVVVGWILRYTAKSLIGTLLKSDSAEFFYSISGPFSNIIWHISGIAITFLILACGVTKGIEKFNRILMPLFFVLFIILAIKAAFLPGAAAGYNYLFYPNWSALFNLKTWIFALGQAFFSLSLAGSGTLIYGSYLDKKEDIISCARNVAFFDTLAALLAAISIIPAMFSFGLDVQSGPALMFIAMPNVFCRMPLGQFFSAIFFIAVLFAALTSLVNLFETPIEALQSKLNLSRKASVILLFFISSGIGILIENAEVLSKWMDILSIYVIPLGALLSGIMFFWICGKKFVRTQVEMGHKKALGKWFEPMTKYVFVGLTLAIYILGIVLGGID